MGLFSNTGEVSTAAYAVDGAEADAGKPSIFDNISDVVTKGISLTGASIVNSFANTAIDVGNLFGAETDHITMADYGFSDETLDFYKEHTQGVEAAGLLIGSLIPGTLAVKALKVAQAGELGLAMQKATGIFSTPGKAVIQGALAEISGDAALYPALQADKLKAIAYGFGDQALQALAFEAATYATMKASPLLEGDGPVEVANNMFFGVLLGAGIGGIFEGIGINKILNQKLLDRDIGTKPGELATYFEKLDHSAYNTGDKVALLLNSLDELPVGSPDTLLSAKASKTYNDGIQNSKLILSKISPDTDPKVSSALLDVMLEMRNNGMPKEEMYNFFSRMQKLSRVTEAPTVKGDPSIFYVNAFDKRVDAQKAFTYDGLISNTADPNGVSRAYRLKPFAQAPEVANATDTIEILPGKIVPKYNSASDAFEQGADIYIGPGPKGRLTTYVNPKAPNIEQVAKPGESRPLSIKEEVAYRKTGELPEGSRDLLGAPLIVNTKTGMIRERVSPVVGDYGDVVINNRGIIYGKEFSEQSLSNPVTVETAGIDANARYVWAKMRGVQRGDIIESNDIAMLEQVRRDIYKLIDNEKLSYSDAVEKYTKTKKLSFSDEFEIPLFQESFDSYIKQQKDTLIAQLLNTNDTAGAKLSAEDIARRANVSENYIENGFKSRADEDLFVDPERYATINHVKVEYNLNGVNQADGNIVRGLLDSQIRIQTVKKALDAQGAAFFKDKLPQFKISREASEANIEGVGAKFFAFSNAPYNSLGEKAERVGRIVTDYITQRFSTIADQLTNSANALRSDSKAAAELGAFVTVRRSTSENYQFIPPQLAAAEKISPDTVVLKNSIVQDARTGEWKWDKDYAPKNGKWVTANEKQIALAAGKQLDEGLHTFYELSPTVARFERANLAINERRIAERNGFYEANGLNRKIEPGTLYAPPIDTKKYPYLALVRSTPGKGMASSDVQVMVAKDAKDLEQKIALMQKEGFEVYTKDQVKKFKQAEGEYDFNRNFNQTEVNSAMMRNGILNNIAPDTNASKIIQDYTDWHYKQESRIVRDHVELVNGQLFAELRAMGDRFAQVETSKVGYIEKYLGGTAKNPYEDYVKTALGVSRKSEYSLWDSANEKVEAFFSTAFNTVRSAFLGARSGAIEYEQASAIAEKYGLGNPWQKFFDGARSYNAISAQLPPEKILSKFTAAANSILGATVIRLDAFQSLINIVSTPILLSSEANSVKGLLTTTLPDGSGRQIPATTKLIYNAVNNYFNKDIREAWLPKYRELGIVRDKSSDFFSMIEDLTLPYGRISESDILKRIKAGADKAAKLTGSNFSEEFVRFTAADVARQIFTAVGKEGIDLTDNIATFVNRVHGNYIGSQRPVAFQGPIGQAIGLFQTYQFNLLQQVFRYIENGEGKTLAIMGAMQTTLFGLQGLPGFQAINNHIIANSANNPGHKDAFSTLPNFFGKDLGDYLLYGTLSNWMNAGLYSRGDINPRNITILPVNPLDYPAISGGIRFIGNLLDTGTKILQGANLGPSILLGLEHNGLSRPLSGLAQLMQGFSTTSQGSLIAATRPNGWSDLVDGAAAVRFLGARPLDEAVIMDAMYRKTLYQAKDSERIRSLGEAVKTTMYAGNNPTPDDVNTFINKYIASGGRVEMFSRKMMEWSLDSNASVANQFYRQMRDPKNQQLQLMMGGQKVPDFLSGPTLEEPQR